MTKERLEELAAEAGFDGVGVARAARAPHADAFREWLAEGAQATMGWLARDPEKRGNPAIVLPGARSVIVLAMNYFLPDEPVADGTARGRIARYARGRDYHNFLPKRLREFDRALSAEGGQQRCFADSGPLLEREFAVLAGMAWHGKSTLAIHPKLGAWFLLAEVITTMDIDADAPIGDRCGKCTRCLEACPTHAIVAPHKLDARKCLSYWTIEHKGPLPEWVRPLLGDRIFGCDTCLEVCPWNRFAQASREAGFAARGSSRWPLRAYLKLDAEGFRSLFEGSPIRRAGRQGFLRNVCAALGNIGDEDDLPSLRKARSDSDPVVAEHAAWAVTRIQQRK